MRNVNIKRTATELTITIDLSVPGERSKSGKSIVIASTEGNIIVDEPDGKTAAEGDEQIRLGLNLYK